MRRFVLRLVNVIRPGRAERELTRELEAHLALLEEDGRRRGLPAEEARRVARRALGGVEQTKERQRDARSFIWLDDARRDLRHASRLLLRNPVFALTAALSLAIGIGANTAIFTLVNALLIREPLGVAEPARLVHIGIGRPDGGFNPTSFANYLDVSQRATSLSGVYAHPMFPQAMSLNVSGNAAERVFAHSVTTSYFTVLGANPAMGRLFGALDSDRPGASPIAVLSHGFWTRRFSRDAAVIGRTIRLDSQAFTIVGVAPEGFQGTGVVAQDMWLPLGMSWSSESDDARFTERRGGDLVIGGRLKSGLTVEQAAAEIDALGSALNREYPASGDDRVLRLVPSSSVPGNRRIIAALLAMFMTMVALVLLVACANVASILLARAITRRREMAVRLAIGAGRSRLVRQLLMETMALCALGGIAGVVLARLMTSLLVPLLPALPFPISVALALDRRVVAFTMGLSLIAALFCGLAPALQASKADVVTSLKDDGQGPSGRAWLRSAFVIAQVALSLVLVVAAGLFVRALAVAGSVNPGFDARGVQLATLNASRAGHTTTTGRLFWRELLERVRQLPNVQDATIARVLPGGFEGVGLGEIEAPGVAPAGGTSLVPSWNIVEPGYFATLRIPLVAGRDFNVADRAGTQPVVVIGEGTARHFWPGHTAIGKFLRYKPGDGAAQTLLVVGVVGDVRTSSLVDGLAGSFVYLPLQQHYASDMTSTMTVAARTRRAGAIADDIRTVVASMNVKLPIVSFQSLGESSALGVAPQRVAASVSGGLGLVGLLLAAIGIYGVTAYAVARRTRDIGIRIALGAPRGRILRMVLGQSLWLAMLGSSVGLVLAAGVSQLLGAFLFGLEPLDPPTFIGTAVLFAAVALLASYAPARRALNIDPVAGLRQE